MATRTRQPRSFDRVKGRLRALSALSALRRVRSEMASDPRVSTLLVEQFTYQLKSLEETIGQVLPERISEVKLDLEDLEDEGHRME